MSDAIAYTPQYSKGFIQGLPDIVNYAKFLQSEFPKAFAIALQETLQEEQAILQEDAYDSTAGWSGLSSALSVDFDTATEYIVHGIPGDKKESRKATDLEYGVPGKNAPAPLIRSFVKDRELDLGENISKRIDTILKDKYK